MHARFLSKVDFVVAILAITCVIGGFIFFDAKVRGADDKSYSSKVGGYSMKIEVVKESGIAVAGSDEIKQHTAKAEVVGKDGITYVEINWRKVAQRKVDDEVFDWFALGVMIAHKVDEQSVKKIKLDGREAREVVIHRPDGGIIRMIYCPSQSSEIGITFVVTTEAQLKNTDAILKTFKFVK